MKRCFEALPADQASMVRTALAAKLVPRPTTSWPITGYPLAACSPSDDLLTG
jgi:hypothetical protein